MSVDKQDAALEVEVGSLDDLVGYLRAGEKPPEAWRIGTEHEKIGLRAEDLAPAPFDGAQGIEALLEAIAREDGWERVREAGRTVGLHKEGAGISLEPGGQLELSGAPLRTIFETCAEFNRHLDLVRRVSEPLGLVWLSLGINPLHPVERTPQVPKTRYRIMREYLPTRGELAMQMMHVTATVQANLDYADEADAAEKMRVATGVTPIVSAIFANASVADGKPTGWASYRQHIWRHTDPDRCGLLPFVFAPDFGYRRWVEWAVDVPMFFVVRDGAYLPARGATFRRFLEEGFRGHRPTLLDFDRHLTTLFPDVRLKQFIEVRGADAVPPGLICALPALWKGILYEASARAAAWELVRELDLEAREAAVQDVARRGLAARVGRHAVRDLAAELLDISAEALRRIGHGRGAEPDERGFLEPVASQLASGRSPGEEVQARWEGDWARSPARLIEYARY